MTSRLKSFDTVTTREIGILWYSVYHDALVNSNVDIKSLVSFRLARRVSNTVWVEMQERVTASMRMLIRNAETTK